MKKKHMERPFVRYPCRICSYNSGSELESVAHMRKHGLKVPLVQMRRYNKNAGIRTRSFAKAYAECFRGDVNRRVTITSSKSKAAITSRKSKAATTSRKSKAATTSSTKLKRLGSTAGTRTTNLKSEEATGLVVQQKRVKKVVQKTIVDNQSEERGRFRPLEENKYRRVLRRQRVLSPAGIKSSSSIEKQEEIDKTDKTFGDIVPSLKKTKVMRIVSSEGKGMATNVSVIIPLHSNDGSDSEIKFTNPLIQLTKLSEKVYKPIQKSKSETVDENNSQSREDDTNNNIEKTPTKTTSSDKRRGPWLPSHLHLFNDVKVLNGLNFNFPRVCIDRLSLDVEEKWRGNFKLEPPLVKQESPGKFEPKPENSSSEAVATVQDKVEFSTKEAVGEGTTFFSIKRETASVFEAYGETSVEASEQASTNDGDFKTNTDENKMTMDTLENIVACVVPAESPAVGNTESHETKTDTQDCQEICVSPLSIPTIFSKGPSKICVGKPEDNRFYSSNTETASVEDPCNACGGETNVHQQQELTKPFEINIQEQQVTTTPTQINVQLAYSEEIYETSAQEAKDVLPLVINAETPSPKASLASEEVTLPTQTRPSSSTSSLRSYPYLKPFTESGLVPPASQLEEPPKLSYCRIPYGPRGFLCVPIPLPPPAGCRIISPRSPPKTHPDGSMFCLGNGPGSGAPPQGFNLIEDLLKKAEANFLAQTASPSPSS